MSGQVILIESTATAVETAALRLALDRFAACFAQSDAKSPDFRIVGQESRTAQMQAATVIVSSLLSELDNDATTPWDETAQRIRQRYRAQSTISPRQYLCTVFRHVAPDAPAGLRARIRKINLLAAELSRETGLFIIDIDRSLADVGARAYDTGFDLKGPYATEAVGHEIAATLLGTGFDASFPREVRDQIKAMMADWHPLHAPTVDLSAAFRPDGALSRAVPKFATIDAQAADFLTQALHGRIRPGDLLAAVRKVIRRDGLGGFVRLVWRGVRKASTAKGRLGP
jgi:hypothetical protein